MVFDKVRDREWFELPGHRRTEDLRGAQRAARKKSSRRTEEPPHAKAQTSAPADAVTRHTCDGSYNDLCVPAAWGSAGTRFGRNAPLAEDVPRHCGEPDEPEPAARQPRAADPQSSSPRRRSTCSRARGSSSRCTTGSATARTRPREPVELPLSDDDPGPTADGASARAPTRARTATRPRDLRHRRTRTGGTARRSTVATGVRRTHCARASTASCAIDDDRPAAEGLEGHVDLTGVAGNFWLGLALLHTLFTREHNAVCDQLSGAPRAGPTTSSSKARLVIAALMAKIHTVEWTPAIIAHPTTVLGLRANWYGRFEGSASTS